MHFKREEIAHQLLKNKRFRHQGRKMNAATVQTAKQTLPAVLWCNKCGSYSGRSSIHLDLLHSVHSQSAATKQTSKIHLLLRFVDIS